MENPEIKRFGRYEIVAELGRGAMGVVYKARDPQIDRLVAVKTVSLRGQEPDEEKEFRMRFMHEAQAAASAISARRAPSSARIEDLDGAAPPADDVSSATSDRAPLTGAR